MKNSNKVSTGRRASRSVKLVCLSIAFILVCSLSLVGVETIFATKSADGAGSSRLIASRVTSDAVATKNDDGGGGRLDRAGGVPWMDGYLVEMNDSGAAGLMNGKSLHIGESSIGVLPDVVGVEYVETVVPASEDLGSVIEVSISDEAVECGAIEELEASPNVKFVQPNYVYSLLDANTNDPYLNVQYYLNGLVNHGANVLSAWDIVRGDGTSGTAVTVAVLDTGIRIDHEDLTGNIDITHMKDIYTNTIAGTITSPANPTGDTSGHGTHVAGIVAGVADNGIGIAGASYNAKVLPLKVFNNESSEPVANTSDLVKAYTYLLDLVQREELTNLHVINMSLGGYGSLGKNDLMLKSKITTAKDLYNILTVCAGGNGDDNGNPITNPMYPGDYDECISVTALDQSGHNATWSDYNTSKDISAPGVYIYSAHNSSASSYAHYSGTSMASPLVAACAALLWVQNDQLTVEQVKDSIYSTAHPVNDPTYDRTVPDGNGIVSGSHGSIDIAAALTYAQTHYPSPSVIIIPQDISDVVVSGLKDSYAYNGVAVEPNFELSCGGILLIKDTDYRITFSGNNAVGTATITVTGLNRFSGTLTLNFKLTGNGITGDKESEAPSKKGWVKEGGNWHYYQADALQKGWQKIGGSWYYLDKHTGHMHSGWRKVDGKWYYLKAGADGRAVAVSGWQRIGEKWYYLKAGADGKGNAVSGLQKIGGKWYYLKVGADGKGSIVSGKIKVGSKTYYFKERKNGKHAMVSGWQKIKGKTYYFKKAKGGKAAMVKGTAKIGGKRYYFKRSGVLEPHRSTSR